ncbi:MAG: hypothetical protein KFF73_18795 [Cyclobacteriaceae bacterium]|nr:hypothetical protein [Cyclobacteriaceae bacterium]
MIKTFWMIVLAVVFFMAGCMNNEEITPPAEDIQTIIQQYSDQLITDRIEIQNSRAMMAMGTYYTIASNSFPVPIDLKVDNLSFYYASMRKMEGNAGSQGFDFTGRLGIYNWNADLQQFVRSDGEANYIRLDFPAESGGQENNASLRINKYAEILLAEGSALQVTSLQMELTIDDMLEMSINYEADFDDAGNPLNLDVHILVNPFELSLDLVQSNGVIQINSTWKKQLEPILSSYFLIARNNINFMPYEGFAFTGKTSGYIKYREIKLDGSFDFSATEIEKDDKRMAVQMALYKGSRKLGRLYIDFQTEGDRVIPGTIKYFIDLENNSRIPADGLVKPLLDGFNNLI